MKREPDLERDVMVQHIHGGGAADRWVVCVGRTKRAEMDSSHNAFVFARLLADLQQRPVWVCNNGDSDLEPLDSRSLRGCSCC